MRTCLDCGVALGSNAHRCPACKKVHDTAYNKAYDDRRKASGLEHPGGQHRMVGPFICQNPFCGKDFYCRRDNRASRKPQAHCSHKCRLGIGIIIREAVDEARQSLLWEMRTKPCCICGRDFPYLRPEQQACKTCYPSWMEARRLKKIEHSKTKTKKCNLCGKVFGRDAGVLKVSRYCPDCRGVSDRLDRFGCAYESVNPYKVFERDGWTCQHCCYVTPEWLRGRGAEGPTLDHILPIAKGGAHSYANTQCLCHECNSKKRDMMENEPLLVGVTDFNRFMVAKVPARIQRDPLTLEILVRGTTRKASPRPCACGCGEMNNNSGEYKSGHWARVIRPSGVYAGCFSKWPPTKRLAIPLPPTRALERALGPRFKASGMTLDAYIASLSQSCLLQ